MRNLKQAVMRFIREEEGLTIVEYAVAGGLITVAVAGGSKSASSRWRPHAMHWMCWCW